MQSFEDPTGSSSKPSPTASTGGSKHNRTLSSASLSSEPKSKKIRVNDAKAPPRISLSAAQISSATTSAAAAAARAAKSPQKKASVAKIKGNQPVPLHIAIARVKEAFPLRRAVKSLQNWEADCARYFKELMRHPWISAARPKFVFHVPVPELFPELRDIYAAKIRTPMDLTTIECTLLAGNRYAAPEDFVQDVALVFSNAILFNRDGRDVGDPLSCAYYDASVHLLRYSRWLSLELLSNHVDSDSEHLDEPSSDKLPPLSWKLSNGNRTKARSETENIVFKEQLEKSLEGDTRWTWMEAECEKLLKALRHQSDLRYMTFFIQASYPADYSAYISRPMDWEKVQKTLKRRQYDTIGNMVNDLRLIFTNALKYNARMKGTDSVSGRAYEAAGLMSAKLETAINKLLLGVSDRLERERIDHGNAEREIEAAERAEEAQIRAAWNKGEDGQPINPLASNVQSSSKIVRRAPIRRQATDFEVPFFDEDNGQHERSYFEFVKFQKSLFEKQRRELSKMQNLTATIGTAMLSRLMRNKATAAVAQAASLAKAKADAAKIDTEKEASSKEESTTSTGDSFVLKDLTRTDRSRVQIKIAAAPKAKRALKKPRKTFSFD